MSDTENTNNVISAPDGHWSLAARSLEQAGTELRDDPDWPTLEKRAVEHLASARQLREQVAKVREDENLSPEGKQARLTELKTAWEQTATERRAAIEQRVEKIESRLRATATVKRPESVSEAALQSARMDARMMLDSADGANLSRRLEQLARSDDPAIRYLLLSGWAERYVLSRGDNGAADAWREAKARALPEALDDEGRAALERLNGVQKARGFLLGLTYAERQTRQDLGRG